jgi:hypothetical protein
VQQEQGEKYDRQAEAHEACARFRKFDHFADPGEDLDDKVDAEQGAVGAAKFLLKHFVEAAGGTQNFDDHRIAPVWFGVGGIDSVAAR